MINPDHKRLSIVRQCELVSISRASFYRQPAGESEENLALMRLIDETFLDCPFYGARQMARHLRRLGWCVGRKRVRRLMRKIGLSPIYQAPKTSERHPPQELSLPAAASGDRAAAVDRDCREHRDAGREEAHPSAFRISKINAAHPHRGAFGPAHNRSPNHPSHVLNGIRSSNSDVPAPHLFCADLLQKGLVSASSQIRRTGCCRDRWRARRPTWP